MTADDLQPGVNRSGESSELTTREDTRLGSELRASELRYRRLFETAQDGILLIDAATGRITDVNPFLENLLGYSRRELIGAELWEIGPIRDIEASREVMRHLQEDEYIRYDDLPLETRSKQRVQVEFVSNVYMVDGVRVIQCNIRDITARKAAEENASALHEELKVRVEEMKQRDGELNLLSQLNELLHACATQEEAYRVIAVIGYDLFGQHKGFLAMLQPQEMLLDTVARWGAEAGADPEPTTSFALGDCWALRRGCPHELVNPREGLVCRHFDEPPAHGALCLPLAVQGETLGILCLFGEKERATLGPVKLQLAVTIGESIKLSLSNLRLRERLHEQAILDGLTGIHNRRHLDESLPREIHRALRRRSPLCVVMIDIDHFKRYNDTFGHDAGDALLREMGRVLCDNVRRSDICCRYGGEEFVLVLPDSSLHDTRQRVDQIRDLVRKLDMHHGDHPYGTITLSAGIAQAPKDGTTAKQILRSADEALYIAKQGGRDRVVEIPQTEAGPGAHGSDNVQQPSRSTGVSECVGVRSAG